MDQQTEAAGAALLEYNLWALLGIYIWLDLVCSWVWNILQNLRFKVSEGKFSHRPLFSWLWVLWRSPTEMPDRSSTTYLMSMTLALPQGLTSLVSVPAHVSPSFLFLLILLLFISKWCHDTCCLNCLWVGHWYEHRHYKRKWCAAATAAATVWGHPHCVRAVLSLSGCFFFHAFFVVFVTENP